MKTSEMTLMLSIFQCAALKVKKRSGTNISLGASGGSSDLNSLQLQLQEMKDKVGYH